MGGANDDVLAHRKCSNPFALEPRALRCYAYSGYAGVMAAFAE